MLKLSDGEIEGYARDISDVLEQVPLFYVYQVLELANEKRQREFEIDGIDTTSSDEESEEEEEEEEEEDEESDEEDEDE